MKMLAKLMIAVALVMSVALVGCTPTEEAPAAENAANAADANVVNE